MLQNICQLVHSQEHYKLKGELQIKLSSVTHSKYNVKSIYIENKVQKAFWTPCNFPNYIIIQTTLTWSTFQSAKKYLEAVGQMWTKYDGQEGEILQIDKTVFYK